MRTVDLASPPAMVWDVLSAFDGISSWADDVDHSCLLSDQSEGVGMCRRIQTGRTTLVERVVDWEPPTTLSYEIEGLPPVVRSATNTWSVSEHGGGSRVELTSSVDAGPRPPQKAIAKLVARKMGQASDQMLAGLVGELS